MTKVPEANICHTHQLEYFSLTTQHLNLPSLGMRVMFTLTPMWKFQQHSKSHPVENIKMCRPLF